MPLQDLLELTQKNFVKKHPETDIAFQTAEKEPPATGLILDNPLLEFAFDRRFIPYGRFILVYGKKGCAKTSLFYDFAKTFQANNGDVIWVETEHAIDLDYAKKQGVDLSKISVHHPDSLEEGLDLVSSFVKALPKAYPAGDTPVLICYDSIAGSATEYELDPSHTISESQPGTHARLLGRFYRDLEKPLANEKCIVMMLNQLKQKIGAMGFSEDSSDALIGGEAQFFHSSVHFKMIKTGEETIKGENDEAARKYMSKHKLQIKRNKLGREGKGQDITFPLYIDGGIDWWSPLVSEKLGKEYGSVVTKRGGYYNWNIPDTHYLDDQGNSLVIDTEKNFRDYELGGLIRRSSEAKEHVRKAFGIPDLPPEKVVAAVEGAKKKKRGRPSKEDEEKPVTPKQLNLI